MKPTLAFLTLFLLSPLAMADQQMQLGIINLDASASQDVDNDELVTRLQVIEDGRDPAQLTDLVNQKTALVLDAVKNFKDIEAETSSYNTRPVYKNGNISSWQVSQQLTLETGNFDQMSQFIADISSLANIQAMQFQVSDDKAEQVKQDLLKQAIANFRDKASLIASEFDRSGYELVNLSIDGNYFSPRPVMERAAMMSADVASKGAPAALAGGSNEVSVTVRGQYSARLELIAFEQARHQRRLHKKGEQDDAIDHRLDRPPVIQLGGQRQHQGQGDSTTQSACQQQLLLRPAQSLRFERPQQQCAAPHHDQSGRHHGSDGYQHRQPVVTEHANGNGDPHQ